VLVAEPPVPDEAPPLPEGAPPLPLTVPGAPLAPDSSPPLEEHPSASPSTIHHVVRILATRLRDLAESEAA
jgi:hypothetical protein